MGIRFREGIMWSFLSSPFTVHNQDGFDEGGFSTFVEWDCSVCRGKCIQTLPGARHWMDKRITDMEEIGGFTKFQCPECERNIYTWDRPHFAHRQGAGMMAEDDYLWIYQGGGPFSRMILGLLLISSSSPPKPHHLNDKGSEIPSPQLCWSQGRDTACVQNVKADGSRSNLLNILS